MAAENASEQVSEGDLGLLRELIGFNLRLSYNRAALLFTREFADMELAPIQFAVLEFVSRNPALSQRDIAEHIGTAPSALVGPLERLEKSGWIERSRAGEDRRVLRVSLSERGERDMAEVLRRIRKVDRELVRGLAEPKRRRLLDLLQDLTESFD